MTEKINLEDLVKWLWSAYGRVKELVQLLVDNKEEVKQARYNIKHLENPKRSDKISDDTYNKLCDVTYNINVLWLSKKIDDLRKERKWFKKELKSQIWTMNLIIEFIKENSKEWYKFLLDNNIILECQLIQQSIR